MTTRMSGIEPLLGDIKQTFCPRQDVLQVLTPMTHHPPQADYCVYYNIDVHYSIWWQM